VIQKAQYGISPISSFHPLFYNPDKTVEASLHLGTGISGGVDNLYRHHDYTIAIVESVSGRPFSAYWLHGEHVIVNGAKMSKSKGNILYPDSLLKKGYTARDIRFCLIYPHYRQKLNLTDDYVEKVTGKLASFHEMAKRLTGLSKEPESSGHAAEELLSKIESSFRDSMNDDLDVQGAFESIYRILSRLLSLKPDGRLGYKASSLLTERLERINGVLHILG
jgi:cysteinyl-tRNA synthetase